MLEANKAFTAVASMIAGYFGGGGGVEEEGRFGGEETKHHFRLACGGLVLGGGQKINKKLAGQEWRESRLLQETAGALQAGQSQFYSAEARCG